MKIDGNNYESYLIDYLEGKMDADQEKALLSFLEANPDLKQEFEGIEKTRLFPSGPGYDGKDELLKLVTPFEEACMDSAEGLLSAEEEKHLLETIAGDEGKQRIYKLYRSTILVPDLNIRFQGISKLKKYDFRRRGLRIVMPAAAAAAVLLLAVLFLNRKGNLPEPQDMVQTGTGQEDVLVIRERLPLQKQTFRTEDKSSVHPAPQAYVARAAESSSPARENIRLPRVHPLGITEITYLSDIPFHALLKGSREDPGILRTPETGPADQGFLALENVEEKAKDVVWKLADAGFKGINDISEGEILLSRSTNDEGRTNRLTFETPFFGISAPVGKTDEGQ